MINVHDSSRSKIYGAVFYTLRLYIQVKYTVSLSQRRRDVRFLLADDPKAPRSLSATASRNPQINVKEVAQATASGDTDKGGWS